MEDSEQSLLRGTQTKVVAGFASKFIEIVENNCRGGPLCVDYQDILYILLSTHPLHFC